MSGFTGFSLNTTPSTSSSFSFSLSSASSSTAAAPSFGFGVTSSSSVFAAPSSASAPAFSFVSSAAPSSSPFPASSNLFGSSPGAPTTTTSSPFGAPTTSTPTISSLFGAASPLSSTSFSFFKPSTLITTTTTPLTSSPSTGSSFTPQPSSTPSSLASSTCSAATTTGFSLNSSTAITPPAASSSAATSSFTGSTPSSSTSSILDSSLPTTPTTTAATTSATATAATAPATVVLASTSASQAISSFTSAAQTASTVAVASTSGTTSAVSAPATSDSSPKLLPEITGKIVEKIIKEWNSELQDCTEKFQKQANAIAGWDNRISQNWDVVLRLETEVAKVVDALSNLERQLELIGTHQQEFLHYIIKMVGDDTTTSTTRDDGFTEYAAPQCKRNKSSKVWREMLEGKNAQGERVAKCTHCNSELSVKRDGGTSHLKCHLDRCVDRPLALRIENDSGEENFVFDMAALRKEIVNFIAEGDHSFSIVEEKGFRRMMARAIPHFVPFGRASAKKELLSCYVLERNELQKMLSKVSSRICLTIDNWKCNPTRQDYICVTAHFVDDAWKLHKRIVRFRALASPYDGVGIANEISMFLSQWKLDDKILSITVDNATYNDVMMSTLQSHLVHKGGLNFGENLFHMRCCAHILNLVVQNGLAYISDIVDNIRSLIKMITESSRWSVEFYECADKVFHLDKRRKLNLDMQVRWNSTFHMLGTTLYFKDVFIHLGSSYAPFKPYIPSEDEWEKVRVIHDFLELFYEVTCMFCALKHPTSNLYFKGAWMIHCHLVEAANSSYSFLKEMIEPMLSKFDKYWSEYNVYVSCAAILDPRYKVKFVEYCCCKLFGNDEGSRRVHSALRTLNGLYNDYKLQHAGASPVVVSTSSTVFGNKNYFDDYENFVGTSGKSQVGKSQLDMYLDDDALDLNLELDILEFWHQSSVRYPVLSKLAKDLLTIPVSTMASEFAFSLGVKTVPASCSSLKSKTVQALVCLQDWHRAKYNIDDVGEVDVELDDDTIEEEDDDDVDPYF